MAYPSRPHLRVPLRIVGTSFDVVEQESDEEIGQCVEAITRYSRGTLLARPEFGIPDPTFRQVPSGGMNVEDIAASIERWEPRASLLIEQSSASIADAIVGVALRLRLTEGVSGG